MANLKASTAFVSRYIAEVKAHIDQVVMLRGGVKLTDTEEAQEGKRFLFNQLKDNVYLWTTKPTKEYPEGQHVFDFVTLEPLKVDSPAYEEALAGKLPSAGVFCLMFIILCHLNEKTTDLDKICMPRQSRLNAISKELYNPSTTEPPVGYATDRKAGWTHEVKTDWAFYEVADESGMKRLLPGRFDKTGGKVDNHGNKKGYAVPLEKAYRHIAENHVQETCTGIKHLGRDATWKRIQANINSNGIQAQIVYDFVARCPECSSSSGRQARQRGAITTKATGGNCGRKKNLNGKRPQPEFNSTEEDNYSPSNKRATKKQRKANNAGQVQMYDGPMTIPAFPSSSTQQIYQSTIQNAYIPPRPLNTPMEAYPDRTFGFVNGVLAHEQQQFNGYNNMQTNNLTRSSDTMTSGLTNEQEQEMDYFASRVYLTAQEANHSFPVLQEEPNEYNPTLYEDNASSASHQWRRMFPGFSSNQPKQQLEISENAMIDLQLPEQSSEQVEAACYQNDRGDSGFANMDDNTSLGQQVPTSFQQTASSEEINFEFFVDMSKDGTGMNRDEFLAQQLPEIQEQESEQQRPGPEISESQLLPRIQEEVSEQQFLDLEPLESSPLQPILDDTFISGYDVGFISSFELQVEAEATEQQPKPVETSKEVDSKVLEEVIWHDIDNDSLFGSEHEEEDPTTTAPMKKLGSHSFSDGWNPKGNRDPWQGALRP